MDVVVLVEVLQVLVALQFPPLPPFPGHDPAAATPPPAPFLLQANHCETFTPLTLSLYCVWLEILG